MHELTAASKPETIKLIRVSMQQRWVRKFPQTKGMVQKISDRWSTAVQHLFLGKKTGAYLTHEQYLLPHRRGHAAVLHCAAALHVCVTNQFFCYCFLKHALVLNTTVRRPGHGRHRVRAWRNPRKGIRLSSWSEQCFAGQPCLMIAAGGALAMG